MGNDELVDMYDKRLGDAGYLTFKLARTNNRGDGMLSLLSSYSFGYILLGIYIVCNVSLTYLNMGCCMHRIGFCPLMVTDDLRFQNLIRMG